MNPVLTRLLAQRAEQVKFIETLMERVESEERDLVEAERSNLTAAKERIKQLDDQIEPLEEFEKIASAHRAANPVIPARTPDPEDRGADSGREQRLGVRDREVKYATAGHFIVDKIRALGYEGEQVPPDPDAQQRVRAALQTRDIQSRAVATTTTTETPGVLPSPIIGDILTDLDGSRPFINSLGPVQPLAGIPGKTFNRPKVSQHTKTGAQGAELTEVQTRQFKIDGIPFTKQTFGGELEVSRQDIDWTSPSAWNALLTDLQLEYGADTDDAASAAFAAAVTQSTSQMAGSAITDWITALYQAAVIAATSNGTKRPSTLRMPNHVWVSLDMWAQIGATIDAARSTNASNMNPGTASPSDFQTGDIAQLGRTMAPGFPAGTVIVGRTSLYEFYEERIGLLQAIQPKILGIDIAYGGYAAYGALDATAFSKVKIAAPPAWQATHAYALNDKVTLSGGAVLNASTPGTSGATAPTPPAVGGTVTDGSVTWTRIS